MTPPIPKDREPSRAEMLQTMNAQLLSRLEEAELTIRAIQQGAVDAFVMEELGEHRVYTLESPDRPFVLFIENMQQGVATLETDGKLMYCNRRLADLLQLPHEGLVGTPLREFVPDDERPAYDELLRRCQDGSAAGESKLKRADGELVPVHFMFNVLPVDGGRLIGAFITDLTIHKQHEQLAAAQEELRNTDRRKNEFLAMLSHELRNPLAPIRNAVGILRLTGGDPAAVSATCQMLERQVGQMVRLVDDLLDVSRITRNKIELRKERVELATVLDQALESIRPKCTTLRHDLVVTLPPEPVYLDGDPVRLTQVFVNLLDNACKYMEKGGTIGLSAHVTRTSDGTPVGVAVHIKDQGMGIAADQLGHIFEMFAQVDSSLERARSGLGIGLTLVTNLVELHGGYIEVHSAGEGQGSEFSVHLPIQPGPFVTPQPEPETEGGTARYRILVVDDNRDSAESLAMLLKLMGHETHTVLDGVQAVELAETLRPDVVLLDIGMPRLNGYDACRTIRRNTWSKSMMLIAQTGWGQEEDRQRTKDAGFDGHLVKPVDPDALLKLLASLSAAPERTG